MSCVQQSCVSAWLWIFRGMVACSFWRSRLLKPCHSSWEMKKWEIFPCEQICSPWNLFEVMLEHEWCHPKISEGLSNTDWAMSGSVGDDQLLLADDKQCEKETRPILRLGSRLGRQSTSFRGQPGSTPKNSAYYTVSTCSINIFKPPHRICRTGAFQNVQNLGRCSVHVWPCDTSLYPLELTQTWACPIAAKIALSLRPSEWTCKMTIVLKAV